MRESPALDIIELLRRRGGEVSYTDPYVPELQARHARSEVGAEADAAMKAWTARVIITDHKVFDYARMVEMFAVARRYA